MKIKKIPVLAVCLLMLAAAATPALAQDTAPPATIKESETQIMPRFSYAAQGSSNLSISGNTANILGSVSRNAQATRSELKVKLLCNGNEIDSWTATSTKRNFSLAKEVTLTEHGSYQVVTTYTVYGPNGSESGTKYSTTKKY